MPVVNTDTDYGFYVDEDDIMYDVESESEPQGKYYDNWYLPIRVGQFIPIGHGFTIVHKLGWGGFSTVWLAYDSTAKRMVALKISSLSARGTHELQINQEIVRRAAHDISDYLVVFEAAFEFIDPMGVPRVLLVSPWRGPSLDTACFSLPVAFRMRGVGNLLEGLKRLHAAGVVHGDINNGSVMWDIAPGMDQWSKDEIYRHVGRPRKVQLSEDQGGGDLVEPVQFPNDLLRNTCRFGDFGHSILSGTVLENPCQRPLLFCAPERFHGVQPSDASDMWSFMCIVFELYTRVEIVYSDGLTFVHRLVGMLGPFPTRWRGHFVSAGAGQDWWYDHTGEMPRTQGDLITLEERLDYLRPEISREERELALQVFRKGFEYLPEKRLTAAQLLEDPSFNALLAYY